MTVKIIAEAAREFSGDAEYYESKEIGLGVRFRNEVANVVDWIAQNPEIPRLRNKGYRRVNLRVFPHYIAYVIREDVVWVVAISQAHRRPEHWLARL